MVKETVILVKSFNNQHEADAWIEDQIQHYVGDFGQYELVTSSLRGGSGPIIAEVEFYREEEEDDPNGEQGSLW
jgi:hypothetical protein